jgi:MioC protein
VKVQIIFGTESGESEQIADEVSDVLAERFDVTVQNMEDVDVALIDPSHFYVVICSTYGEGDLPSSAQPFYDALQEARPDLGALRYAILGRGDQTYVETYSQGSEQIDRLLTELGATRIGEFGRQDAGDWDAAEDLATTWITGVIEVLDAEEAAS